MGIIDCPTHGHQAFLEVYEHIGNALETGARLRGTRLLSLEACDQCVTRHDLMRFVGEDFFNWSEAGEALYNVLHATSQLHCVQCIAAAELRTSRNAGQPDPFVAYERTLTFLQRETIDHLRDGLIASFHFAPSIVVPKHRAVWVLEGAVTRPLEITIYYVTDPREQDAILAWLASFFLGIPRNQYHVRFYREENWKEVPVTPPAVRGFERGPEEIVREHRAHSPRPDDC